MRLIKFGLAAVVLVGTVAAACGGGDDEGSMGAMDMGDGMVAPVQGADLTVNLTNWQVSTSTKELSAGTITVAAVHPADHGAHDAIGATHQLVISPLKAGAKHGTGSFDGLILNLANIKVGETKSGEVTLEPGEYELACLIVEDSDGKQYDHYKEGMHTSITVK